MNKVYSSKEIARIFHLIYNIDGYVESIEEIDAYDDLLGSLLGNIEGRIIGDELLLKNNVGAKINPDIAIDDDESYDTLTSIIEKNDGVEGFDLVFDESCKLLVEKRLKAYRTLYDAISELRNSYKED